MENIDVLETRFQEIGIEVSLGEEHGRQIIILADTSNWTFVYASYGFQKAYFETIDEKEGHVTIELTTNGRVYTDIKEVRIRMSSDKGFGYNNYLTEDFSKPIYGPVTDDGGEEVRDQRIKQHVSEKELEEVVQKIEEYRALFDEICENGEAVFGERRKNEKNIYS